MRGKLVVLVGIVSLAGGCLLVGDYSFDGTRNTSDTSDASVSGGSSGAGGAKAGGAAGKAGSGGHGGGLSGNSGAAGTTSQGGASGDAGSSGTAGVGASSGSGGDSGSGGTSGGGAGGQVSTGGSAGVGGACVATGQDGCTVADACCDVASGADCRLSRCCVRPGWKCMGGVQNCCGLSECNADGNCCLQAGATNFFSLGAYKVCCKWDDPLAGIDEGATRCCYKPGFPCDSDSLPSPQCCNGPCNMTTFTCP